MRMMVAQCRPFGAVHIIRLRSPWWASLCRRQTFGQPMSVEALVVRQHAMPICELCCRVLDREEVEVESMLDDVWRLAYVPEETQ